MLNVLSEIKNKEFSFKQSNKTSNINQNKLNIPQKEEIKIANPIPKTNNTLVPNISFGSYNPSQNNGIKLENNSIIKDNNDNTKNIINQNNNQLNSNDIRSPLNSKETNIEESNSKKQIESKPTPGLFGNMEKNVSFIDNVQPKENNANFSLFGNIYTTKPGNQDNKDNFNNKKKLNF